MGAEKEPHSLRGFAEEIRRRISVQAGESRKPRKYRQHNRSHSNIERSMQQTKQRQRAPSSSLRDTERRRTIQQRKHALRGQVGRRGRTRFGFFGVHQR